MATKKFTAQNIMRVVDIFYNQFSKITLEYLQANGEVTYIDQVLKENIYNIDGTLEEFDEAIPHGAEIKTELDLVNKLVAQKKAGYIRIIYS